jgi:hypothetical protein
VWLKNGTGINERCLKRAPSGYVGIKTGNIYSSLTHYHSQQSLAQIIDADSINQTGMLHLFEDGCEENRKSWKEKYIGCFVTVEEAHKVGELTLYRCLELNEYFSSNELRLLCDNYSF